MTAVALGGATEPWTRSQLQLLAAINVTGLVLLVAAWSQSADEAELAPQVAWLNLAVLAVVLASGVDILWLTNGRRTLLQRRRDLLADVPIERARAADADSSVLPGELVHLAGGTRAHRRSCALVAGKPTVVVDGPSLRATGTRLRRCEVCRP